MTLLSMDVKLTELLRPPRVMLTAKLFISLGSSTLYSLRQRVERDSG